MQSLQPCEREALTLRDENKKINAQREELRKSLLETTSDLKEESERFNKVIMELENNNRDLQQRQREKDDQLDDLENKVHSLSVKINQLENENNDLRVKLRAGALYKKQLEQSRQDYLNAEKKHVDSLANLSEKLRELEGDVSGLTRQRAELQSGNRALTEDNLKLRSDISDEK